MSVSGGRDTIKVKMWLLLVPRWYVVIIVLEVAEMILRLSLSRRISGIALSCAIFSDGCR
jgi:hypothetical protein